MARLTVLEEYEYRRDNPTICHSPGDYVPCDIQGHLQFLHDTVLGYEKPVVIELGIQAGNSNSALLSAAERRGGIVYSCDLQTRDQLQERNELDRVEWWDHPSWRVFCGDDLSPQALAWMPEQCDILFVDADHARDHVLAEMACYMPRVRPGGIALFHDTQFRHPNVDLGEPKGEVAEALDAYCDAHGLTWENRPGFYGMGVVRL